jgi:hypothetical protein
MSETHVALPSTLHWLSFAGGQDALDRATPAEANAILKAAYIGSGVDAGATVRLHVGGLA